jgi:hypothetical protein
MKRLSKAAVPRPPNQTSLLSSVTKKRSGVAAVTRMVMMKQMTETMLSNRRLRTSTGLWKNA